MGKGNGVNKRARAAIALSIAAAVALTVGGFALVTAPPSGTVPAKSAGPEQTPSADPTAKAAITLSRNGDPLEVLFAQDSIGAGRNASFEFRAFRPLVVHALRESGAVTELAYGAPGFTVQNTSDYIPSIPSTLDLAIVEVGTNDARLSHSPPEFTADYTALLDRITTAAPDAALICLGTLAAYSESAQFDSLIQSMCEQRGGHYVTIADISANPADLAPAGSPIWDDDVAADSIHPNDAGHAKIAARILALLGVS